MSCMPISSTASSHSHTIYSTPLRGTQIRLLALQPKDDNERLVCRLRTVDVADESLLYEAISYVWGSQDTPANIYCKDDTGHEYIQLPIPQNAADALEAFREPKDERLLWIDSICISQASLDEKSAQVAMMDLIFSKATATLIWLGSDSDFRPAAAEELFDRMANRCRDATPMMLRDIYRGSSDRPYYTNDEIGMLLNIFECEWVWRLWCVQELVLAKKAWVHWATVKMTWNTFSTVAIYIQAANQGIIARTGLAGIYNVTLLESLRRQLIHKTRKQPPYSRQSRPTGMSAFMEPSMQSLPFSRLMSLTRMHGVTDRRDRIFSLLGLDHSLCRMSLGTNSEPPLVTPKYAQRIEDLYTSVARKLLCREKSLYLLSFVQHQGDVESRTLPSWVPQWHINNHRLITQFDFVSGHPVTKTLDDIWRKSKAAILFPPNTLRTYEGPFYISKENVLQVEGLLLATVSARCSGPVFTDVAGDEWLFTLRHWLQDVVSWFLGNDKGRTDSPSQDQVRDVAFRVFYRTILGGHLRHRDVDRDIRSECKAFRALLCLIGDNSTDSCPTTQAFLTQVCRSRKLFLTTDGQLGIGPSYVLPGDAIFALSSAAVPLLLRPRPRDRHRWALLGEVYVNGLVSTSDDYGPEVTSFAHGLVKPGSVKALPSQQAPSVTRPGTLDIKRTLDRNAGKARTRDRANNSPPRIVHNPHEYPKRKDDPLGTCERAKRQRTFSNMPQALDVFPSFSSVGNETTSHPHDLDVSRESSLL
jgi:hypothetical protein